MITIDRFEALFTEYSEKQVEVVRRELRNWLLRHFDSDFVFNVIMAISEIASNVIKHGGDTTLYVVATIEGRSLTISFQAEGHAQNRVLLRELIARIELQVEHDFCETEGGGGLRIVCGLSTSTTVDDHGNFIVTFDPAHTPRLALAYSIPVVW